MRCRTRRPVRGMTGRGRHFPQTVRSILPAKDHRPGKPGRQRRCAYQAGSERALGFAAPHPLLKPSPRPPRSPLRRSETVTRCGRWPGCRVPRPPPGHDRQRRLRVRRRYVRTGPADRYESIPRSPLSLHNLNTARVGCQRRIAGMKGYYLFQLRQSTETKADMSEPEQRITPDVRSRFTAFTDDAVNTARAACSSPARSRTDTRPRE